MGFDNLIIVFGCSIVTDSLSKMFGFSTVSSFWASIFDCVIEFHKWKADLEC